MHQLVNRTDIMRQKMQSIENNFIVLREILKKIPERMQISALVREFEDVLTKKGTQFEFKCE